MKKIESGRSMIEMLGVLAIVGVLSIGGLAGYQMAMNRYRASALSDYASRCVVVAQTKYMSGRVGTGTDASCNVVLNEAVPSFLGTGTVTIADTVNGVVTVTATTVPDAVLTVLNDRFNDGGSNDAKSIGGVKFAKSGTTATFTFGAS